MDTTNPGTPSTVAASASGADAAKQPWVTPAIEPLPPLTQLTLQTLG